jgi:hypothetical protein
MRRRDFISIFGSAVAWPLAVRAQQAGKPPTIGFLGANNATFERASTDAFVQRLRELGWIENRTVAIEYRWAEGRDERFAEIAAEFIQLKVDVILTYATPSSIAAKKATAVIPIVFWRPSRHGAGRFTSATGRQHHRPVDPANRSCQQAPRNVARDSPRSPNSGGLSQYRQPKLRPGNG